MTGWQVGVWVEGKVDAVINEAWVGEVVGRVLQEKGVRPPAEVGVVITDDPGIQELNRRYLNRDQVTDVLAFSLKEGEGFIPPPDGVLHLGEVILCYPQAVRQAQQYSQPLERELALLLIHGALHLLGYDDENAQAREQMNQEQSRLLAQVEILATYPPNPLPLIREGGVEMREGLRPSLKSLPPLSSRRRGGLRG